MGTQYKDDFKRVSQNFSDKPATTTNSLSVPFELKKAQPINIPGASPKEKVNKLKRIFPKKVYLDNVIVNCTIRKLPRTRRRRFIQENTSAFIVGSLQEKTPVPWPLVFETTYNVNQHRLNPHKEARDNQFICDQLEDKTDMADLIFDMDDSDASSCDDLIEVCKS